MKIILGDVTVTIFNSTTANRGGKEGQVRVGIENAATGEESETRIPDKDVDGLLSYRDKNCGVYR